MINKKIGIPKNLFVTILSILSEIVNFSFGFSTVVEIFVDNQQIKEPQALQTSPLMQDRSRGKGGNTSHIREHFPHWAAEPYQP